jgi:hypothetical protein
MKPYGRIDIVQQNPKWKKDYHVHDKNHRKIRNWWEDFSSNAVDRITLKHIWKKEIEDEL